MTWQLAGAPLVDSVTPVPASAALLALAQLWINSAWLVGFGAALGWLVRQVEAVQSRQNDEHAVFCLWDITTRACLAHSPDALSRSSSDGSQSPLAKRLRDEGARCDELVSRSPDRIGTFDSLRGSQTGHLNHRRWGRGFAPRRFRPRQRRRVCQRPRHLGCGTAEGPRTIR